MAVSSHPSHHAREHESHEVLNPALRAGRRSCGFRLDDVADPTGRMRRRRVHAVATAGCRLQILVNPETDFDRWLRHEIHQILGFAPGAMPSPINESLGSLRV